MKKSIYLLLSVLLISLASSAKDSDNDFFAGKWEVTIMDTPKGDAVIHVTLKKADGEWTGEMLGITEGDKEPSKFDRVEEEDGGIAMYWVTPDGYSVYLFLEEDGEDLVVGTMVDSFDVEGTRIKE